ncbi:unnamed protein product, partial [Mesorhabditis spiculigera]
MVYYPNGGADGRSVASPPDPGQYFERAGSVARQPMMRYLDELLDEMCTLNQLHDGHPGALYHTEALLNAEMDRLWSGIRGADSPYSLKMRSPLFDTPRDARPILTSTPKPQNRSFPRFEATPYPQHPSPPQRSSPPSQRQLYASPLSHVGSDRKEDEGGVAVHQKIPLPPTHGRCNFIGRILGPRGLSVRQLEAETGCSVIIRGEGSVKDPEREARLRGAVGWEHLNEPLHALVTARGVDKEQADTKLAIGVEAILGIITNADDGQKKQQLVQLAIINGTYRAPNNNDDTLPTM